MNLETEFNHLQKDKENLLDLLSNVDENINRVEKENELLKSALSLYTGKQLEAARELKNVKSVVLTKREVKQVEKIIEYPFKVKEVSKKKHQKQKSRVEMKAFDMYMKTYFDKIQLEYPAASKRNVEKLILHQWEELSSQGKLLYFQNASTGNSL